MPGPKRKMSPLLGLYGRRRRADDGDPVPPSGKLFVYDSVTGRYVTTDAGAYVTREA